MTKLKLARGGRVFGLAAVLSIAGTLSAQTVPDQAAANQPAPSQTPPNQAAPNGTGPDQAASSQPSTASALDIPDNLQIFGKLDPNVRKATAIVNGTVITGTDVDQRAALLIAANNLKLSAEERDGLRRQVLRNLIDETLQIGEAKTAEITITQSEIDQSYARIARGFGRAVPAMTEYLRSAGSSERSLRRQIEGELAWQRFLQRRVEPFVNVGDEEVKGILDRLQASKGTDEYHLKEIYLSATPDRAEQVYANMRKMIEQIQKGEAPFEYSARQYSESSTRSVGGDLDWIRPDALPASLAQAAQQMQVGQIAGPIEVPGGMSILYLVDKRQVLTSDARDARLQLKQLTIRFPAGTTQAQASVRAASFAKVTQSINGCGDVNKVAGTIDAEVVDSDAVVVRDLPPALQDILLKLQIGQATPPFGSPEQGVRSLVLCGREDPQNGSLPSADRVQAQMEQARVNLRAQQLLRDLRRDAIVEYR